MRTPIIAGNWKMNKNVAEAVELVRALREATVSVDKVEMVVCPPFIALTAVKEALAGSKIAVGAQNMHWEEKGAYTGEISPLMLKGLVTYVIIGHSERRQYFGETDVTVNKRVKAALAHGLLPIMCVGETLAQREAGETAVVVTTQVMNGLAGLSAEEVKSIVIAYEPVWAIGTGRTATPEIAADAHKFIRSLVAAKFGAAQAGATRILYGGSVKPDNVKNLMAQPDIDGALVGGASLEAVSFSSIVNF